jgi:PadR family transcriptional regulator PadR
MPTPIRLSHSRLNVLARFVEANHCELSGADLMPRTGLASGSLYPILYALEDAGVLESRWESEDPQALGRPRKRLYKLTALGAQTADTAGTQIAPLMRHSAPLPGTV